MTYSEEQKLQMTQAANDLIKDMPYFAKKFFSHLTKKNKSYRTILQYAYDMSLFFKFLEKQAGYKGLNFKTLTAAEMFDPLTIDDINEYLDTLETYQTIKKGTVTVHAMSISGKARRTSSLRSFFKYYRKIGEINTNIANIMDLPEMKDKDIVAMDKDEVQRILAAVTDHSGMTEGEIKRHVKIELRDYAIMMLFLGTGLRVSELVGIDLDNIDFINDSVVVVRKGGNEDRVYFPAEVADALNDYIDNCREELLAGNENDALFISMKHNRMAVRSIEEMIKVYQKKAGISAKVTPHTMRRSFATNLYNETGDIYLVAEALNHSSVETTRKHYAKLDKERKRLAAKEAASTLFKND